MVIVVRSIMYDVGANLIIDTLLISKRAKNSIISRPNNTTETRSCNFVSTIQTS